jgi:hypothetical protein
MFLEPYSFGRGKRNRTSNLSVPNRVLYLIELHPEKWHQVKESNPRSRFWRPLCYRNTYLIYWRTGWDSNPRCLYSRLKVYAVRHYGNQSFSVAYDLTQTTSIDFRLWLYSSKLDPGDGLEPPTCRFKVCRYYQLNYPGIIVSTKERCRE